MLKVQNLSKSFDGTKAVQEFSMEFQQGRITSIIGPNGAGKTTVFNIVTGFLQADSGTVLLDNLSLVHVPPWKIANLGLTRTFQNLRLFRKMSVVENVLLARQHQSGERFIHSLFLFSNQSQEHKAHLDRAISLLEFVGLGEKRDDLAEHLSYGQQKLLSIACCLATEPSIIFLDEPVAGVQPEMIEKIITVLKHLVEKEGKTVVLIEHNIDVVMRISDTIVVMDDGKKIVEGTPLQIQNNPEILEAYLS